MLATDRADSARQIVESQAIASKAAAKYAPLSIRAFVIGLSLSPLLIFWAEYTEIVSGGADLIAMSLIMAVVTALLALLAVNALLRRWLPRLAFTQAELMLIYTINTTSIGICGLGMMQFLPVGLAGPFYFDSPASGWKTWMYLMRPWAFPKPSALGDYYNGKSTLFTHDHLAGWAAPMVVWSCFIFALLYAMYCLSVLLRRQWIEREKLIFPIAAVPLEITDERDGGRIWNNKYLWMGFALSMLLESLAALHYTVAPAIPYVPLKASESLFNVGQFFSTPPWTGVGGLYLGFYPLVIGITYFLSLDVSFSCWFFYFCVKIENVLAVSWGMRDPKEGSMVGVAPHSGEQAIGAFAVLGLMALASAYPYLAAAFKQAFLGSSRRPAFRREEDDADEPMTYRSAYVGLIVCGVFLIGFAMALGIALPLAAGFFGLYLLYAIAASRIRAEAGLPWSVGPVTMTHGAIVTVFGGHTFGMASLTGLAQFRWFDADWRDIAMPNQMEALKIADGARINPRHTTAAVVLGIIVSTIASWLIVLGIYYHYGAANSALNPWRADQGHYPYDELMDWLKRNRGFDNSAFVASVAGGLVTLMLSALRRNFASWPLHPLGYAVANTGGLDWMWMSVCTGWFFKWLILRYGGMQTYRKALPFFVGLTMGDFAAGALWSLIALFTGMPGYRTFPI